MLVAELIYTSNRRGLPPAWILWENAIQEFFADCRLTQYTTGRNIHTSATQQVAATDSPAPARAKSRNRKMSNATATIVKCTNGNEIYSHPGKKDRSEVRSGTSVKFSGTYRQCVKWVKDNAGQIIG